MKSGIAPSDSSMFLAWVRHSHLHSAESVIRLYHSILYFPENYSSVLRCSFVYLFRWTSILQVRRLHSRTSLSAGGRRSGTQRGTPWLKLKLHVCNVSQAFQHTHLLADDAARSPWSSKSRNFKASIRHCFCSVEIFQCLPIWLG